MATIEEQYIEDFNCFRHYVLCYQPVNEGFTFLASEGKNDLSRLVGKCDNFDRHDIYSGDNIVILENVDTLKPADFYCSKNKGMWSTYFEFLHLEKCPSLKALKALKGKNKRTRCDKDLYLMKLNRKWKVTNISRPQSCIIYGKTIYYRTASIRMIREDFPRKK